MNTPFYDAKKGKPYLFGKQARILVAPLDWGLGHATRCIPIIYELMAQGCDVYLAGEGKQKELLQQEFPYLHFLELHGYKVSYAKSKIGLIVNMVLQIHKIKRAIKSEQQWLQKVVDEYAIDAVISDNRYGLYHQSVPSIFITHQLIIKTGFAKWTETLLQKQNYKYINKYTACWVPDAQSANNLAGDLSHPTNLPTIPVHYINPLSRFKQKNIAQIKSHLLILLSGPEPQRSILEEKIISQVSHYNGTATVVRGLPGEEKIIPSTSMIKFYNHLPAEALNDEMQKAEYVIGRNGYTTVMDIALMKKKSALIPTPGQTEQTYLAKYLEQKNFTVAINQNTFTVEGALEKIRNFNYQFLNYDDNTLKKTIDNFINQSLSTNLG